MIRLSHTRPAIIGAVMALALVVPVPAAAASAGEPFGPSAPANPALAATTGATMHGDSASAKAFPMAGPGRSVTTTRTVLAAACAAIVHGSDGYPVALCTDAMTRRPVVHLLDPATGGSLASLPVAPGSLLGGVYAYLDDRDQLVLVDGERNLLRIGHGRGYLGRWRLTVTERTSLVAVVPADDAVTALMPGYDGRVWFATAAGVVGVVAADGTARTHQLPAGERVANSISTAPGGRTAVVSTHALYVFDSDAAGAPRVLWRAGYDRGVARKPGQLSWGSGATPVFFGPATGTEYVAITDNADPHMRLRVLAAANGDPVCSTSLFTDRTGSGSENAVVASGRSVFVVNTYGYDYPALPADAGPSVPADAPFSGGVARIDVAADGGGCEPRWSTRTRSAALPRLSMADRTIYTVVQAGLLNTDADPFHYATVDADSGSVTSSTGLGFGLVNPLQMTGTVTAGGVFYQGTLTGLVRVAAAR
ncbi:hypothetical protein [Pilimelia columellifera]|uniref:Uncharacterized protein n=1 Tax=Pilimelia columellifera subsp. columellifera TaxID=706583 RepID=A0ABN3N4V1_9ACTN